MDSAERRAAAAVEDEYKAELDRHAVAPPCLTKDLVDQLAAPRIAPSHRMVAKELPIKEQYVIQNVLLIRSGQEGKLNQESYRCEDGQGRMCMNSTKRQLRHFYSSDSHPQHLNRRIFSRLVGELEAESLDV